MLRSVADVQRELAAVRAEQDARAEAGGHHDPGRPHDVSGLTAGQLERVRRELAANLALVRPDSPARVPILAHLSAIDTELAGRAGAGSCPNLGSAISAALQPPPGPYTLAPTVAAGRNSS